MGRHRIRSLVAPNIEQWDDDSLENERDGGELPCSNLESDEGIRLNGSDHEESENRADEIDNIPVNPETYVARDDTECGYRSWQICNSKCFATKQWCNNLRET
ncbi:hypothetical protein TNCV_4053401 [Trichonephila clavipes]|nr:hypothetical protein TNCV_4053401 [Trichonephila clavipes]